MLKIHKIQQSVHMIITISFLASWWFEQKAETCDNNIFNFRKLCLLKCLLIWLITMTYTNILLVTTVTAVNLNILLVKLITGPFDKHTAWYRTLIHCILDISTYQKHYPIILPCSSKSFLITKCQIQLNIIKM